MEQIVEYYKGYEIVIEYQERRGHSYATIGYSMNRKDRCDFRFSMYASKEEILKQAQENIERTIENERLMLRAHIHAIEEKRGARRNPKH